MLSWEQILTDVQLNWWLYLSMPFIAAAIGYGTKVVAIRMMFEPLEFVGKPPYLGWQGIVPRRAAVMTEVAVELMTSRLLRPADVFGKLDPARVAAELEKPLLDNVEDITRAVAAHYSPRLWELAPESVKQRIIRRIQDEAPQLVEQIMIEVRDNIDSMFDLKSMVVEALMRDKALLNRIFLESGAAEFDFIRRSGLYFGFAIGCVQAVVWAATQNAWVIPLFGGFIGWFTDWLALKMIFEPKHPKRYLGLFEWQGLFLKRRAEVSAEYGRLIAREVITPRSVIAAVLRGPLSDRLFAMVQKQVQRSVDEHAGIVKPFVIFAVGSQRYQEMKREVADQLIRRLPDTLRYVERYAGEAMDLERTLSTKMQALSPEEFEGLLRPAFQQDEWILIAVGAALGFIVGEIQVQLMLHFAETPPAVLAALGAGLRAA